MRDGAAQARKIGERGVGGKRENNQDRTDGQVVKKALAEDRGAEHGEHALVAGLAGIGGSNSVSLYQIRNSRQQHRQEKNDYGESALGIFHRGSRKAFTPLLTASTPVSAVQPLAKTFSSSQ